jgi:hypothetical protein
MAPPVPTELQIRKFRKRFRVLDSDGNGVLDVSDYETVAQRIRLRFHLREASPEADRITAVYRELFARMHKYGDLNNDHVIDENEFVTTTTWSLLGRTDGFDRAILPTLHSIGEVCGLRSDTVLTDRLFEDLLAAEGVTPPDILVAHAHLLDSSASFTFADLVQANRDFYCSADPAGAGNWLLGDF